MPPRKVLVVDDLRVFKFEATYARTFQEALALLESKQFDEIWLDHDLGEVEGKIRDVKPVVELLHRQAFFGEPIPVEQIVVHTSNNYEGAMMVQTLEKYYNVIRVDARPYLAE